MVPINCINGHFFTVRVSDCNDIFIFVCLTNLFSDFEIMERPRWQGSCLIKVLLSVTQMTIVVFLMLHNQTAEETTFRIDLVYTKTPKLARGH